MNKEDIIQSLRQSKLKEGETIEFKNALPKDLSVIAKVITSMANTKGGEIIIGVSQKGKALSLLGINNNLKKEDLKNELNEFLTRSNYEIDFINIEGKTLIVISVYKSDYPVFFIRRSKQSERLYEFVRDGDVSKVRTSDSNDYRGSKRLYQKVYKYMNLDSFLCSLYGKSIRFSEPSKWPDKYETRFYCANYDNITEKEYAQKLYATCVTRAQNNEAAWKVYARNEGLSGHCVQLDINVMQLRKELKNSQFIIEERFMVYCSEHYILNLHKKESNDYNLFFNPFSKDNFLRLLSLKWDAFKYEEEIRFFAIPEDGGERSISSDKAQTVDISVNWGKLLNKVRIDKKCTQAELAAIIQACHYAGINPKFSKEPIDFVIPSISNGQEILFELYDIDELPDSKSITIE